MRRRALFVWFVAGVLALAGCSEPQQANDTLPTAPATTSAEPTLEPLGPDDFPVPDDARVQTEAGALAMTTYYVDLIDYLFASLPDGGETSEWLRSLSDSCQTCTLYADQFDAQATAGERNEGADASFEAQPGLRFNGESAELAYILRVTAGVTFDAAGNEASREAETQLNVGQLLMWDTGRSAWITRDLQVESL